MTSSAGPKPKRMFWVGGWAQYIQRITSAPIFSIPSSASIAFPRLPCISRPVSSSSFSYESTERYGRRPVSVIDMNAIEWNQSRICSRISETQSAGNQVSQYAWSGSGAVVSPVAAPLPFPASTQASLPHPSVDIGTIPASSQTSPTSVTRSTSSPQASQRIRTSSIQGRCSSSSWSSPRVAFSRSSASEPITVTCPQRHG